MARWLALWLVRYNCQSYIPYHAMDNHNKSRHLVFVSRGSFLYAIYPIMNIFNGVHRCYVDSFTSNDSYRYPYLYSYLHVVDAIDNNMLQQLYLIRSICKAAMNENTEECP